VTNISWQMRLRAAGREGLEGAIAGAKPYVEAGARAVFPEALTGRGYVSRIWLTSPYLRLCGVWPNSILHSF
jgi:methylisocitrate lyase